VELRAIEKNLIFEGGSRATLYAFLTANGVKAWHVLLQWTDPLTAGLMAFAIEATLMIATQTIAERRVWNATKKKSEPEKAVGRMIYAAALFFGILSAVTNTLFFADQGANLWLAVMFGGAAPIAVGFIAFLIGDEAAVERRVAEEQRAADERKLAAKLTREQKKARKLDVNLTPVDAPLRQVPSSELSTEMQARVKLLVDAWLDDPDRSLASIASECGVSRTAAANWARAGLSAGLLEKPNGKYQVVREG